MFASRVLQTVKKKFNSRGAVSLPISCSVISLVGALTIPQNNSSNTPGHAGGIVWLTHRYANPTKCQKRNDKVTFIPLEVKSLHVSYLQWLYKYSRYLHTFFLLSG